MGRTRRWRLKEVEDTVNGVRVRTARTILVAQTQLPGRPGNNQQMRCHNRYARPGPRAPKTHRSIKCAHTQGMPVGVAVEVVVRLVGAAAVGRPECNKLRLNSYGFVHVRWRMRIGVI